MIRYSHGKKLIDRTRGERANNEDVIMHIHIVYVTKDYMRYDDEILEFCAERGIRFTFREFDSIKYSDDRDNIKSLPAMHLYIKKLYRDTLYPTHTLFDSLNKYYQDYHNKPYKQEKKTSYISWIKIPSYHKLFRRITNMPQLEGASVPELEIKTPIINPLTNSHSK